ncbi:MAG: RNA polymerase-binding protein DksA, partial [Alphaproteobacteria bacterium]|nr:RNA polymerase-binding protein DksA [Alphaproteobacteria bacterium]
MSTTLIPPDYVPSDEDDFMNPLMTEFFRQRLIEWRNELVRESDQTLINIQTTNNQEPDISDRASLESNRALELRTRDRGRKLISKIDAALRRIDAGEYGYCEVTGD